MPRNPLLRLPAASARTWPGPDAIIAVPCAIFGLVVASATAVAVAEPSADGEDRVRIDTIIVTGTRIEQTTAETGSTVRIIDAEEIAALGFSHALDAVARAPGVTVNQNGTFGGSATVRIRGASSAQTLVLIDGVSVNDASSPGGGFNFARLETGNIERIEILSGPQSTLWGADAIGGVVSITTRRPGQGLGGSLFAQAGSYGTFRGGASVSHGGGAGDFRLAATRLNTDGVSRADKRNGNTEDDGLETLTLSARGGLNLPRAARLEGSLVWNDSESEFDSFHFGAQGNVGDGDELSRTEELSGHLALKAPLFGERFHNLLLVGRAEIDRENFSDGLQSFEARGERTLFRYQGTLSIDARNTLVLGAEREESSASGNDSAINGLFALYEWQPVGKLTLTGGLRSDDHERFGAETTGRVAAAFRPVPNLTLRASWGQGFKPPTIFQTTFFCCGAPAANDALRPERSEGVDFGAEWRPDSGLGHIGVTYFRQDTEDLIDFSFAIGGYQNIDEVESKGIEVSAGWNLTDAFALSADYAYIKAREGDGTALRRLPKHSGDLALSFDPSGPFSGTVLLRFNGRETNSDGSRLDDWARVDVNARYALSERLELFGRVENLFDTHYQQILGYGTPGLSGSVGVRWRY
ncbi:MAG: TonB-dependent receptor [Gammaproteobacteria bacterium]|nr:TonB-dependent receptor [Gammaproteobacteria bacterium]